MSEKLVWYSLNEQHQIHDQPPVDLAGALDIARKYFACGDRQYITEGEAGAATVFGIRRDQKTYIEIAVHRPDNISYHFKTRTYLNPEASKPEHALDAGYSADLVLKSWEELEEKIRQFYTEEPSEIRRRLARQKAAVSSRQLMMMAAFIVYVFVGALVYGDRLNMACNRGNGCSDKAAILIWPYYVFGQK
jgi:hypothetical protein